VEWKVTWGGDAEDVLVVTSGTVTVEDLNAFVQEILNDPRFRLGLHVLIDHRLTEWSLMTTFDLRRRVDLLARDQEKIDSVRSAFLVGTPTGYGIGRMMLAFLDGRTKMDVKIFLDIDAARRWLAESSDTPPAKG
jgi:hypothetical protein